MNFHKYFAELLGTFALTLAVSLSLTMQLPFSTPLLAGLTLGLFVYTVGHLSGAHLNPAVTIGMWTVGKVSHKDALMYVIVQVLGALLALAAAQGLTGETPLLVANDTWQVGVAEALGTFFFVFGVSSVVFKKVDSAVSGLVVGASLMLGIHLTGGLSHGFLNPAVAIGVKAISWFYLLAPVVGAIVAAWVYRHFPYK